MKVGNWKLHNVRHRDFFNLQFTIFLVFLTSCASGRTLLPQSVTPEEIVRIASTRLEALHDFRCEAKVVIQDSNGARQSALTAIAFRVPNQLKIEATNLLGISLMTLLAREDSLLFYLPSEHRVFETARASMELERLIGFDTETASAGAFFLGIPDMTGDDLQRMIWFSRESDRCVVRFTHRKGIREMLIDRRSIVVIEERLYDVNGQLLAKRVLRDYRRVDRFPVPRQIEVSRGKEVLNLRFTSFQLNRGVPDEVFRMHLPKGVVRGPM